MAPARALLVALDFPPAQGGIARLLGEIVRGSAADVEWRVLTLARGSCGDGAVVVHADSRLEMARRVPPEAKWLRQSSKRLVVCGHVYALTPALLAARIAGAPLGALVYGKELVPVRPTHSAALALLRLADRVVAISGHTAQVARRLGVDQARIRVVTPLRRPSWATDGEPTERAPHQQLRLVTINRLSEGYKNIELLLRAVSVLQDRLAIELLVIGDGPRRPALEHKARVLGVGRIVQFAGMVDDAGMGGLLATAHLGVFPSRESRAERGFEGFGLVVHELAAAGLPVLVGRAAGAVDAADSRWSLLLDPDDLRGWTRAIEQLADDESRRLEMAGNALNWSRSIDPVARARDFVEALAE